MSDPAPGACEWQGDALLLRVYIQPRAGRDEIIGWHGGAIKVRITAPPVDGKANAHLIRFLAKAFGVPRTRVSLIGGETSRLKRLRIDGPVRLPQPIPPRP